MTKKTNIPDSDFFDIALKYESLALLLGQDIRNFSTSDLLVSLSVRYSNKRTNYSSSNALVSLARLLTILRMLSVDM